MTPRTCGNCEEEQLLQIAIGVYACPVCDYVPLMPFYIEVKGKP